MVREFKVKRILIGRLSEGDDLLKSLTEVVKKNGIKAGVIMLLGALKKVRVGYYNRELGEYEVREASGFFELTSCIGNISYYNGNPVIHIHMVAASKDGSVYSGHVLEGNIVDATVEYMIFDLEGALYRVYDETIKLKLLDV